MAQANTSAQAPSRSKKIGSEKAGFHDRYLSLVPAIKGLLGRGDSVADIAAYLSVDPGFIAAIADETIRICGTDALDVTHCPALPCCRSADVEAALDRLDAVFRSLQEGDQAETVEHLVALRRLLESYKMYWSQ